MGTKPLSKNRIDFSGERWSRNVTEGYIVRSRDRERRNEVVRDGMITGSSGLSELLILGQSAKVVSIRNADRNRLKLS